MDSPLSPPVDEQRQLLDSPYVSQLSSPSFNHKRKLLSTRRLTDFELLRQLNTGYQQGRDSPVWGQQQYLDSPNATQLSPLAFGHRRNLLPVRRLIDFEPLRQPNTTYQHGRDSPPWGQQQPPDPLDASRSFSASFDHRRNLLPVRRLIDFEPLRQPKTRYQHGRDSPVWGQPLDSPNAAELDQPLFQSDDPFLPAPRPIDLESFGFSIAPLYYRGSLDREREPFFVLPDESGLFPREWYAPEFQIVYSNGWINAIPIRPLGYEWLMLPVQPSQYDRDSLASEDSERLSINGPGAFQDPRRSKWLRAHHRSMSIERACKAWEYELRNNSPNSDPIDADTKNLFGSLERLEMSFVQNPLGTEAPQESFVKEPPKRYEISKEPGVDLKEENPDIEYLPVWLRRKPTLGIRLPPGMVNLAASCIPDYLVRKLADPLRFLPSKLSFKKNFPFRNVIPEKGQIGLHPAFRTAAPELILKAERELELAKERRVLTPEEAWKSPIIGGFSSDAKREHLWEYPLTTVSDGGSLTGELQGLEPWMPEYPPTSVSDRGSPTNELKGFDQLMPETHSRSVDGGSFISVFFDQTEAFADVDEVTILYDKTEAFPDVDEAMMFSNEFRESPNIDPVTMFPGRDIEYDQDPISSDQVMKSPIVGPVSMESPVEDQAAMAEHPRTESPVESQGSEYYFGQGMEYLTEGVPRRYFRKGTAFLIEDQAAIAEHVGMKSPSEGQGSEYYFGQVMEYLTEGVPPRHFRKGTESPIKYEESEYSVLEMAYRNPDRRAPIFYDQDTEHRIEEQDQEETSSSESIESSEVLHEGIPIIRWFFDHWEDNSEPSGEPSSSKQVEKTKKNYKRNSADFAHLPPIDFTKSYMDFSTTPFGKLMTSGGLEDYPSRNKETVQKTAEVTEDPQEPTEVYGPENHNARMQKLFAEIELEGATRILTTWQEVYVERGEEGGPEEEGAQEKQAETALEGSKENIVEELAVTLQQKYSKIKGWFGGLSAKKEDKKERRKSQGAELEPKGKLMNWLGGLASAREQPTLESFGDTIGSVPQGPADQLKQTEKVLEDSQEKIETELIHPLERKGSKRRSWFPGNSTEKQEQTEEVFEDSQEKIDPGVSHPLERKRSKRATWFGGHPAEKEGRTSEDSHGMLIQEKVHPLERKELKRRSWLPGHPAEKEEQTKLDPEDSKLTQESVHPLERKGSKRRSWLPGQSAETEVRTPDDSHGKIIQDNVQPLERKASKRRSWFPGHPAGKEQQIQGGSGESYENSTQASVNPLERTASKRRSWLPGHPSRKEQQIQGGSGESYGNSTQASVNPLERTASKRRSWFPGHPSRREQQTQGGSGESYGNLTQASINPLERKASKRRSWFPRTSTDREVRTSEDSHGNSTQPSVNPLERKASKRRSWFGMVPPENEERTEDALEGGQGNVTQEPVTPLERKPSKRMSLFGRTPAKRVEQTNEVFEGSTEAIIQTPAEPSEQMPAKRKSWLGGLNAQKEKQTKKAPDDNDGKITQGPADHPERKHRKRASLFGLPSEKEKTEREIQEERKRKRSSWFV
ncbi:hypothetical protein VF21_00121 [Pseudogymnoascus sp. 05NY08]|nr:hypothetical protein VF21_00174 [Pseudogymnoascus sp. 05NY08]OBT80898.1 hypothetical protein VF21_00121 [Pseudogymnoascus sp. 05NY08]